jgi:trafficking protein particle complex subunit 4
MLNDATNYPLNLKFGRPKMTINEKIFLASMFYPLFAIASQLSPEPRSSGIETLEADTFKLQCFQTLTGTEYNYLLHFIINLQIVYFRSEIYGYC